MSRVSRWLNRTFWTGHDRPICASIWSKYIQAHPRSVSEAFWLAVVVVLDLFEEDHCRNSWRRWVAGK